MRRRGVLLLVVLLAAPAAARAASGGPEATLTDTLRFSLRVEGLVLRAERSTGSGTPLVLDHIPLGADGKRVIWLAQIARAEFSAKGGGVGVRAVLQGEGDVVSGVVEKPRRYTFEGRIARGPRKGRRVRFPLVEVRAIEVHTRYEGLPKPGEKANIPPLPGPNDDVLWVSSVPLGATVFAKPLGGREAVVWKKYKRLGVTPFVVPLAPGTYAVRVFVPPPLARTLQPSTKLGEDTNPFEPDGWGELRFATSANVVESMTYTVRKRKGKAATLIALFQRKDQTLDEVIETFPKGRNFRFNDKKLEGALLFRKVPKADVPRLIEALHRGGKIIWHGPEESLMIELVPGERGWRITGAHRPAKKR